MSDDKKDDAAAAAAAAATAQPKKDEPKPAWKPRKGAPCIAVVMFGGPRFVKIPGKLVAVHADDGRCDVEFQPPGGPRQLLERVPVLEGGTLTRTGVLEPGE